ncbi:MAG: O-antigen ligase family protein [Casimicrobiaceae bacterium]
MSDTNVGPIGPTFFFCFAAFLLLAPLYRAGNRPLPLMLLELAALGVLARIVVVRAPPSPLPGTLVAGLLLLAITPLAQLVPLPLALSRSLPGHALYADVQSRFASTVGATAWPAISVVPQATEAAVLALLPPLASLLLVPRLAPRQVARLMLAMSAFAGAEALLGLMQVGAGGESIFYLRNELAYGTAVGTFVNRNHLAAMLAMTLPIIVGLLVYGLRRERRHGSRRVRSSLGSNEWAQRTLLFGCAVLILLCLVFTRSRAGIGTGIVGLAGSSILFARARSGTRSARLIALALGASGLLLALVVGIAPVLERFQPAQLHLNGQDRLAMYAATVRATIAFMPFGSGLGTFRNVFPHFQDSALAGYVDHAHNDYLQAAMELGIPGVTAMVLLLVAYGRRLGGLLQTEDVGSFTLLQLAAAVGMLPAMLHSLVDFPLHMPANAMWFATLAGVLFHPGTAGRRASVSCVRDAVAS